MKENSPHSAHYLPFPTGERAGQTRRVFSPFITPILESWLRDMQEMWYDQSSHARTTRAQKYCAWTKSKQVEVTLSRFSSKLRRKIVGIHQVSLKRRHIGAEHSIRTKTKQETSRMWSFSRFFVQTRGNIVLYIRIHWKEDETGRNRLCRDKAKKENYFFQSKDNFQISNETRHNKTPGFIKTRT